VSLSSREKSRTFRPDDEFCDFPAVFAPERAEVFVSLAIIGPYRLEDSPTFAGATQQILDRAVLFRPLAAH
jgi:hypothetical protein